MYKTCTLKGEARMRRGQGMRRRVTGTSKTPTNLRSFLRDDDNKTELFQFLVDTICQTQTTSTIIVTKEACVICNDNQKSLEAVSPCPHEETDTRIFVHARDAAIEGSKALVIKANDTDIVIIAVSVYYHSCRRLALRLYGLPLAMVLAWSGSQSTSYSMP